MEQMQDSLLSEKGKFSPIDALVFLHGMFFFVLVGAFVAYGFQYLTGIGSVAFVFVIIFMIGSVHLTRYLVLFAGKVLGPLFANSKPRLSKNIESYAEHFRDILLLKAKRDLPPINRNIKLVNKGTYICKRLLYFLTLFFLVCFSLAITISGLLLFHKIFGNIGKPYCAVVPAFVMVSSVDMFLLLFNPPLKKLFKWLNIERHFVKNPDMSWFGVLKEQARGKKHDMDSIRKGIAEARKRDFDI